MYGDGLRRTILLWETHWALHAAGFGEPPVYGLLMVTVPSVPVCDESSKTLLESARYLEVVIAIVPPSFRRRAQHLTVLQLHKTGLQGDVASDGVRST